MAQYLTRLTRTTKTSDRSGLPIVMAADSTQKQKQGDGGGGDEAEAKGGGDKKMEKKGSDLKDEMDALVEDIDAVLEENAEEFVKNYVQRGGQ